MPKVEQRSQWGSKLGFILAAAGSAIGLGSLWRFPYMAGESGGAVFLLLYLALLVLLVLPCMFSEFALGRFTGKNPLGAIEAIRPKSAWRVVGLLSILIPVFVTSYYAVIGGWAFGYIFKILFKNTMPFDKFIADPLIASSLFSVFLVLNVLVVYKGVEGGIERCSKMLMPLLFVLMAVLAVRSLTLPGAHKGLVFYLQPDFSKLNGRVVLNALGQALFSLSVGMGAMITYASYVSKKQNMLSAGGYVTLVTAIVAFTSGLIIFPALFAFGEDPAAGPQLVFIVLVDLFAKMPFGNIVGAAFFLLMSIAAFTTIISFLEVPVSYLIDERRLSRATAAWGTGAAVFILGIPSVLASGINPALTRMRFFGGKSYIDWRDFLWGTVGISLCVLLISIFVGWVWGADKALTELKQGSKFFDKRFLCLPVTCGSIWKFFIRYICPLAIAAVLIDGLITH